MDPIVVNGTKIHYVEKGSGSPVVFVHGGLSDHRAWSRQVASFAAHHRAIAISRRYAWPNDPIAPGVPDRMEPHVADLAALLPALGAEGAHLVGNSWGAFIALRLAIERPDLVRSLTLQEPPAIPLVLGAPPSPARLAASLVRWPRGTLAVLRFAARTALPAQRLHAAGRHDEARERFARGVLGDAPYERLPQARVEQMRANVATSAGQALVDGGFAPLSAAELRRVRAPTLLVEGSETPAFLLRLSEILGAHIPRAQRVTIEGASHIAHEERPDAYDRAVLAFLRRHEPTP